MTKKQIKPLNKQPYNKRFAATKKLALCCIYGFALISHSYADSCKVGKMSCEQYCSGPIVVKLYQLIGQGLKPLCTINVVYRNHRKADGACMVQIGSEQQAFNQYEMTQIALAKDREQFNKVLAKPLLKSTYLCPNNGIWY